MGSSSSGHRLGYLLSSGTGELGVVEGELLLLKPVA